MPLSAVNYPSLVLVALCIGGCAAQQDSPLDALPGQTWQAHSTQLSGLRHWTARGKVAVRTAETAESATLQWQQQGEETDLRLQGPLGINAITIHSDGEQLEILYRGERRVLDIASRDSLQSSTGWDLPVGALVYWLKGLPSPDLTVQALDVNPATGLLAHLAQGGWHIDYLDYGAFGSFTLPQRLQIKRGMTEAKVIIARWQTEPD
ncbi:MAG: outer membrane lipoprotein LolB [Halioglobus sp.]|nr:outer membrane lipoprotein LolB [Halioglobus sp.]